MSLAASSRNGVENPGPRCSRRAAAISRAWGSAPRSVCTSDRTSRQSEMIDPRRSSAEEAPPKRRPRGSRRTVARKMRLRGRGMTVPPKRATHGFRCLNYTTHLQVLQSLELTRTLIAVSGV